jgi:hypothetical protein
MRVSLCHTCSCTAANVCVSQANLFHKRACRMHRFVWRPVNLQWAAQFRAARRLIPLDQCVFVDEMGAEPFQSLVRASHRLAPGQVGAQVCVDTVEHRAG